MLSMIVCLFLGRLHTFPQVSHIYSLPPKWNVTLCSFIDFSDARCFPQISHWKESLEVNLTVVFFSLKTFVNDLLLWIVVDAIFRVVQAQFQFWKQGHNLEANRFEDRGRYATTRGFAILTSCEIPCNKLYNEEALYAPSCDSSNTRWM